MQWPKPWCLHAPEFVVDDDPASSTMLEDTSSAASLPSFSSFDEYASKVLGIILQPFITHVAWTLKTPTSATIAPTSATMAYRFVDPTPFMPPWGQRVMVPGRTAMHRVVIGRVQSHNNDVAIAFLHPLPPDEMNFEHICDTLAQFLNVQMNMPYQSI